MLWLLIVVVVLLALFGGVGYGYRDAWGGYYSGGLGILGTIIVLVLLLWLLGAIRF